MISLNDQPPNDPSVPLTARCFVLTGSAQLSLQTCLHEQEHEQSAYIHTKTKGTNLQGILQKCFCTRVKCIFGNKWKAAVLQAPTTRLNLNLILLLRNCHLRARRSRVRAHEPLSKCSLNALPVFAWTPSGCSAFLPQACSRAFRVNPATALDRGTGLRTGVGPRTRRCDSPQLLK